MLIGSRVGASRARLTAVSAAAGLLALTVSVPAAGMPLMPVPEPVPPATSMPTSAASAATSTPVAAPNRVDRRWPRNPPWDACPRPVWPGTVSSGQPGAGRRVLIIGDSLTRESRTLSATGMRRHGWTPTFRCWGSRRLDWGIDQVVRSRQTRQLPQHVIVALGTNDISWETPATTERRVRTLLDRLGRDRTVLWVDLHLTRSAWLDARAAWFNDLLRRLAKQRPNLTVVPWHAVARAHGIRGWDGIHYGPYGYRLRARTVLKALDAAGRRDPVPTPRRSPTLRLPLLRRLRLSAASAPGPVGRAGAAREPSARPGRVGRALALAGVPHGGPGRLRDDSPGIGPCQAALYGLVCYP